MGLIPFGEEYLKMTTAVNSRTKDLIAKIESGKPDIHEIEKLPRLTRFDYDTIATDTTFLQTALAEFKEKKMSSR